MPIHVSPICTSCTSRSGDRNILMFMLRRFAISTSGARTVADHDVIGTST
ncbi:Uncharacterised protein [Mycobacteroides abscessus subsp. bolletii]|nr:Uncharacterised protein [Mycobacteroides abscessus subsp. bolletii]